MLPTTKLRPRETKTVTKRKMGIWTQVFQSTNRSLFSRLYTTQLLPPSLTLFYQQPKINCLHQNKICSLAKYLYCIFIFCLGLGKSSQKGSVPIFRAHFIIVHRWSLHVRQPSADLLNRDRELDLGLSWITQSILKCYLPQLHWGTWSRLNYGGGFKLLRQ